MAKKSKLQKTTKESLPEESIAALGWRLIALGASCAVLGFIVLTRVDRMGRNWAADVSPLLILGGYALIGLGLFVPADTKGGGELPPSSPPARP